MQRFKSARRLHFLPLIFMALIVLLLPSPSIASTSEGVKVFRDALARYRSGDYAGAAEKFAAARPALPVIGDYALYYRAKSLQGLKSYVPAEDALHELGREYPDTPVKRGAASLMISVLSAAGDDARLLGELERYTAKYPSDTEARLMLAAALKRAGHGEAARKIFKEIYIGAGRRADEAGREINTASLDTSDLIARASNLIDEAEYAEAEAALRRAMKSMPAPIGNTATEKLAYCLFKQKKYTEAAPMCVEVGQGYMAARAYLRAGKIEEFERVLHALVKAKEPKAGELMLAQAEEKRRTGHMADALGIFVQVSDSSPALREEAVWRMGWTLYANGSYRNAANIFSSLYDTYKAPRYMYWKARATERSGGDASKIYAEVDDDGFYGLMAHLYGKVPLPARKSPVQCALTPDERIDTLVEVGLGEDAARELLARVDSAANDGRITEIAYRLRDLGRYRDAIGALHKLKDAPRPDEILYPMAFWKTVEAASAREGLDPFLVLSVMREESRYDPEAFSPAGAIGLMQLMPQTARRAATALDIRGISDKYSIMDADNNIRMGAHYLGTLIKEFNSVPRALAAYNAGTDKVRLWMGQAKRLSGPDEFIEDIPFQETRDYVKRILSSYYRYRMYPQYTGGLGAL